MIIVASFAFLGITGFALFGRFKVFAASVKENQGKLEPLLEELQTGSTLLQARIEEVSAKAERLQRRAAADVEQQRRELEEGRDAIAALLAD